MFWRLFPVLFIAVVVVVEAGYRWVNELELSWAVLAERAVMLALIFAVSAFFSRREARKRGASESKGSKVWPIFYMLFSGVALAMWTWTTVGGLLNGRIIASSTPDIYTFWTTNPAGFVVTVGFTILGGLFFLAMFVFSTLIVWNDIRARHGPAWP